MRSAVCLHIDIDPRPGADIDVERDPSLRLSTFLTRRLWGARSNQGDLNVLAFDFEVTTTSFQHEAAEYSVLSALYTALDFGEADDLPFNTGFPVSGTSEYRLTFNVTHDADFRYII